MDRKNINKLNTSLVNKMMEKYNITYNDILSKLDENKEWKIDGQDWYDYYTLTEDEYQSFKTFALNEIKKKMKYDKSMALEQFGWWYLDFGLTVED